MVFPAGRCHTTVPPHRYILVTPDVAPVTSFGVKRAVMLSLASSGNSSQRAGQYRSAARVHAASGSFAHPKYTVLQVCQPAGERDILRRSTPRPAAVSPGHGSNRTSSVSAEVRHFRPETAEYLHLWRGIKRCDCTAGQSFNLSDLCRSPEKYIRFEHQFGMGILLSHRPPSGRAAPVTGRPHTNAGAPRSRSAWRRNDET